MVVKNIPLEQIEDNPYNPRKYYQPAKVKEMALSLRENGLRQMPEGREVDGKVQLAYGHMRFRGFKYNAKEDLAGQRAKWQTIPIDVNELTDQQMFDFSLEENLQRTDITPLEVARGIEYFSQMHPEVKDEDIAKKHGMTPANVSNMKRVLKLPAYVLEKIDEEAISFTQGRELLTLDGLENAEEMMKSAVQGLKTVARPYGYPNTVEGLQYSIHSVIQSHFKPLEKESESWRNELLFSPRDVGCLECTKTFKTHPQKSRIANFCMDKKCWELHQKAAQEKAAAAAKAKMEADILKKAAVNISQEKPPEEIPAEKAVELIKPTGKLRQQIEESYSGDLLPDGKIKKPFEYQGKQYVCTAIMDTDMECYLLILRSAYEGEIFTYKTPKGRQYEEYHNFLRDRPEGFYHGMVAKLGKNEYVLVGPELHFQGEGVEKQLEQRADQRDKQLEILREKANRERKAGELPCVTCLKGKTCDRSLFYADQDSNIYVCDTWEPPLPAPLQKYQVDDSGVVVTGKEIPPEIMDKAKEKAGTRAEVLDINPFYDNAQNKGAVLNNSLLRIISDPKECLERCTKGFHYAFDSRNPDRQDMAVCTDPSCITKKKAAFTREKNAEGQARKKAETKAVKEILLKDLHASEAMAKTIIYTLAESKYLELNGYLYSTVKKPKEWLWDKLSPGTKGSERKDELLWQKLDKVPVIQEVTDGKNSCQTLANLLMEMVLYYLVDHGDIGEYEIHTALPLKWFGVSLETAKE